MKIKVTWTSKDIIKEKVFEKELDKFMKKNSFKRWGSGYEIATNIRDIAYENNSV